MNEPVQPPCRRCGAPLTDGAVGGVCAPCFARGFLADALDGGGEGEGDTVRYMGDYELIERLGEGGMGVVWRARQRSLNRFVAVKLIKAGVLDSAPALRRFRHEAEAVARLQHPHIVAIHEAGQDAGRRYFSMDLVSGRTLAAVLAEAVVKPRLLVEWLRTVSRAVHHAHEQGVLHCDLKPGNIMIDDRGLPRVLDFGLARAREASDTETTVTGIPRRPLSGASQFGVVAGTPGYMAPEQRSNGLLDRRTDVFALGAILARALTGREPAGGGAALPSLPSIRGGRDLAAIGRKCLAENPAERYRTVAELADDLDRWLAHQPVAARPVPAWERAGYWGRRHPALVALGCAGLLVLGWGLLVQRREVEVRRRAREIQEQQVARTLARVDTFVGERFGALWSVGRIDLVLATVRDLRGELAALPPGRDMGDTVRHLGFQLSLREAEAWGESRQPVAAEAAARRALDQALAVPATAGGLRWRTNTAIARGVLGDALVRAGDARRPEALALWEQALAGWEQLAADGFAGAPSGLAEAWLAVAHQQALLGRVGPATGSLSRAEELWGNEARGTNGWALLKLGECQYVGGIVALTNRLGADAARAFTNYLELSRRAVDAEPREVRWQAWLATAHLRIAEWQWSAREDRAARAGAESAWIISRSLVARDPANLRWQALHTRACAWRLLMAEGQPFTADQREWHRDVARGCEVLLACWPGDWEWLNDLAHAHSVLAGLEQRAGHLAEAAQLWRRHQAVREQQAGVPAGTAARTREVVEERARGYRKLATVMNEAKSPPADLLANARAALDWAASVKGGPSVARDVAAACLLAAEAPGRDAAQFAEGGRLVRACRDAYFTAPVAEIDRQYAARLEQAAAQRP